MQLGNFLFESSHGAVDIRTFGVGMAGNTSGNIRQEAMIFTFAHMAAYTSVFNHGVVRTGFAFYAQSLVDINSTQQGIDLDAIVCIEAGSGSELVGDHIAIRIFGGKVGHVAASLVAVSA